MSLFRLCVRFAAFSGEFPISHLSSSLVAVPSASVFMHPLYRSYRNKASEFHIFVHILFISCADRVAADGVKGLRMRLVHLGSIRVDCQEGRIGPRSQAFIQISAVFAELERSSLRTRARPGMTNAAAKGKQIGRPQTTREDIPAIFYKHYPAYAAGKLNVSKLARVCGLSRPTVYKYLRLVG